jgi:hypothetical protein
VRSHDVRLRDLIARGYAQSATFRRLVDTIEDLPCIVYVTSAVKLSGGVTGALLHTSAGLPELPILRVLVKTNLPADEAIWTIGHELQHVVEAVGGLREKGGLAITATFDALSARGRSSGGTPYKYETEAAIIVATQVRDELRAAREVSPPLPARAP